VLEYSVSPVDWLSKLLSSAAGKQVSICLEITSLDALLAAHSVFDIYYEYCCYYTRYSVMRALECAGWRATSSVPVLDGRYLWVEASSGGTVERRSAHACSEVCSLADADSTVCADWLMKIQTAKRRGPVAVWGAGGKGNNFVSLVDPDRQWLDCLVDINVIKQGRFAPCTAHPIVSPETAVARGVKTLCLLNPIYREEVDRRIEHLGADIGVIV
jgi:hypothetical protein